MFLREIVIDDKLDTLSTNKKQQTAKLSQPQKNHLKTIHKNSRHAHGILLSLKYPPLAA